MVHTAEIHAKQRLLGSIHCRSLPRGEGVVLAASKMLDHVGSISLAPLGLEDSLIFVFNGLGPLTFLKNFDCSESSLPVWAFSSCDKRDLLFLAVPGLLVVVASPVSDRTGSRRCWLRVCGSQT